MAILKKKYAIRILCLCTSILAGCAAIQGNSIKIYHAEYSATVQASAAALESMQIPIFNEVSDELKTEFLARRPDGTPVTVEVKRVDRHFTQVSVGAGGVVDRYLDPETAALIHGFIRGRLGNAAHKD